MRRKLGSVVLVLLIVTFNSLYALDFTLKPVRLFIYPNKTTTVFEIQSLANHPIAVETEAYLWEQDNTGKDVLTPTENLIVVPPYIELKPKEKQLVRVAYVGGFDKPQEFYRIFLRQIPSNYKPPKNPSRVETRVQILLNISFPVFVIKDKNATYNLSSSIKHLSKEKIVLSIVNNGNGFAKIKRVLFVKEDKTILDKKFVQYIFPQKELTITFNFSNEETKSDNKKIIFPKNNFVLNELPDKIILILDNHDKYTIYTR